MPIRAKRGFTAAPKAERPGPKDSPAPERRGVGPKAGVRLNGTRKGIRSGRTERGGRSLGEVRA